MTLFPPIMPRPWKDRYFRRSIYSSMVGGAAIVGLEWWILGFWVGLVIVLIYFIAVPYTLKHGYHLGWIACSNAHARMCHQIIESTLGGPSGSIIDSKVEDASGNPPQSDHKQLP